MRGDPIEKLDYLIAVAEEQSMTRAAKRLFISQPALTAYINRLEEELGVKLFNRSVMPIKLTAAGSHYIATMTKMRTEQYSLINELKHLDYDRRVALTIGIGQNRGMVVLPRVLPLLYAAMPEVRIQLVEERDTKTEEMLANGQLDIAVLDTFIPRPFLTYQHLNDERHVLITGASNPLTQWWDLAHNDKDHPADVAPALLNGQVFICPSVKGTVNQYLQRFLSTYHITPKDFLFVSNNITGYQLAVKGMGVILPNTQYTGLIRTKEQPVFFMPGAKASIRRVYAVYDASTMTEPKRLFIECAQKALAQ